MYLEHKESRYATNSGLLDNYLYIKTAFQQAWFCYRLGEQSHIHVPVSIRSYRHGHCCFGKFLGFFHPLQAPISLARAGPSFRGSGFDGAVVAYWRCFDSLLLTHPPPSCLSNRTNEWAEKEEESRRHTLVHTVCVFVGHCHVQLSQYSRIILPSFDFWVISLIQEDLCGQR